MFPIFIENHSVSVISLSHYQVFNNSIQNDVPTCSINIPKQQSQKNLEPSVLVHVCFPEIIGFPPWFSPNLVQYFVSKMDSWRNCRGFPMVFPVFPCMVFPPFPHFPRDFPWFSHRFPAPWPSSGRPRGGARLFPSAPAATALRKTDLRVYVCMYVCMYIYIY